MAPRTPHLHRLARCGAALLSLAACLPDVDADLSLVDAPRILAVSAEPAEVAPGKLATLTALYADASGTITVAPLDWAVCTARRPLAELGPVDPTCLERQHKKLAELTPGISTLAKFPQDACRLYGPDPPPAAPGEPSGRVVDPDATGGYHQPLRVFDPGAADDPTLVRVRLACGLAGATQQQAADHRKRYLANLAPTVTVTADDRELPIQIPRGHTLPLRAAWPTCPTTATCGDDQCFPGEQLECPDDCAVQRGCTGAETYLRFDPERLALVEQREAMRVAWYTTAGTFAAARTGRAGDDPETFSDNPWTAPDEPGPVTLWAVVRDDRGATAWHTIKLAVE